MKLSAPKQITFLISLIIAVIAVLVQWTGILSFIPIGSFILLLIGFILLALGTYVKGL